ncbi:MAG TPA: hypothetical protein VH092_23890 [Urbifossiella sp.]|jgi:hypothetical protein|nr:hypothetical protein [Urbifossiella sp.]
MDDGYRTVFEASVFDEGAFFWLLGGLAVGLVVAGVGYVRQRRRDRLNPKDAYTISDWRVIAVTVWCAIWIPAWFLADVLCLLTGWTQTTALRDGRYDVVEGTVEVPHLHPVTGRAPADRVRVAGRVLDLNRGLGVGYSRNVAEGGDLTAGRRVRLSIRDGAILRIEVPARP